MRVLIAVLIIIAVIGFAAAAFLAGYRVGEKAPERNPAYADTPAAKTGAHTHEPFLTYHEGDPHRKFADERMVADAINRNTRRIGSLERAIERDIHEGRVDMPATHEVIDGRDLDGDGVIGMVDGK